MLREWLQDIFIVVIYVSFFSLQISKASVWNILIPFYLLIKYKHI
jgi:hypothetical protein